METSKYTVTINTLLQDRLEASDTLDIVSTSNPQVPLFSIPAKIGNSGFNAVEMRNELILKNPKLGLVFHCILVGLIRGNNIDKIRVTVSKTGADILNEAIRTFRLKKSASGHAKAVTLSRMIACFPDMALEALNKKGLTLPVHFNQLKAIHAEYPRIARNEVCASIIPESLGPDTKKALDIIMVPFLINFEVVNTRNFVWNRKSKERKISEVAGRLLQSYRSRVLTKEFTDKLATDFGMIDAEKKLSSTWNNVAIAATAYLKENYNYSFTDNSIVME